MKQHTTTAKLATLAIATSVLAACGGGGDGSTTSSAPANSDTPLAKYIGQYELCDGNEKMSLAVTAANDGALTLNAQTTYFDKSNCSGSVVATEVRTPGSTARYQAAGNRNTSGVPGGNSNNLDMVLLTQQPGVIQLSGGGVNGKCIKYSTGNTCLDSLAIPASTANGGLLLQGATLYFLIEMNGRYEVDSAFAKR